MINSPRKIHNPKSHAPAVYIPCWLIQVPQSELSHFAKILYGRLAQWSNTKGHVSRSAPELSAEMGCQSRVIERGLKELREVGLIETHQVQKGGVNSFIFLDHPFMHRPLQDCLDYYEQQSPVDKSALSPDKNVGTPPTEMSVPPDKNVGLKYKEIKEIEKDKSFCSIEQKINSKSKSQQREENAKVHDFAESKNNAAQGQQQRKREARHIEEHEKIKRSPMPPELKPITKNLKIMRGSHDNRKDGRRMQKDIV